MKLKGLIVTCRGQVVEAFQTTGNGASRRLARAKKDLQKAFPGCKIDRFTQDTSLYSRARGRSRR